MRSRDPSTICSCSTARSLPWRSLRSPNDSGRLATATRATAILATSSRTMRSQRSETMATAEEALKKMREICLSLPDTREGEHFGQAAFYVKRKLFATCGDKRGVCEITFGLEADHAAALAEKDP